MDEETFSVIDNLISTSATDALSAKQGKVLNEKIEGVKTDLEDLTAIVNSMEGGTGGGQDNVIEIVMLNGEALSISEKSVNIPVAGTTLGVVKSSTGNNKVTVAENGEMSVSAISVTSLVQAEGETIILNCGSSAN